MEDYHKEICIPTDQLPYTIEHKRQQGSGMLMLIFSVPFALAFLGFLIARINKGIRGDVFDLIEFSALIFLSLVAFILTIVGLNMYYTKDKITISKEAISYLRKTLFKENKWNATINEFEGFLSKEEFYTIERSAYTIYTIELYHKEQKKNIIFYQSKSGNRFNSKLKEYCESFNLPAIQETEDGIISCNAEDLNKSMKQMLKEKKLKSEFDASQAPPKGIKSQIDNNDLIITMYQKGIPVFTAVFTTMLPLIAGAVYIDFFHEPHAPFPVFTTIFSIFNTLAICYWLTKTQIHITDEMLHIQYIFPWGQKTKGKQIFFSQIKDILVKGSTENKNFKSVYINTVNEKIKIGGGHSVEVLNWLKNFLIEIIKTRSSLLF